MAAVAPHLTQLSEAQRQALAARLQDFEQNWKETRLVEEAGSLPPSDPSRVPVLLELVRVDLAQRWRRGERVRLEKYLTDFPELGPPASIPVELVRAEHETRIRHGDTTSLEDLRGRFPRQVEQLGLTSALVQTLPPPSLASDTGISPQPTRDLSHVPVAVAVPGELPEHFGRYHLIRKLGQGGMGAVYLAHDTRLDRSVALKLLPPASVHDADAVARFRREARALARLSHPGIVRAYDSDEAGGRHFLVMELVE